MTKEQIERELEETRRQLEESEKGNVGSVRRVGRHRAV